MTLLFRLSIVMMLGVTVGSAAHSPASAAVSPPPLKIDLNAFDAMKKTMALPDGETLAYIDMGNPAGPAVVLIHGYTDSARDWVPMLPYLSKKLRLILVDIRGHGQSSKPECCYTRLDFAYDIKLLLDGMSVQKADLVGHSLGSIIAQTFAEYWPERTDRVVLISSTGGLPPGAQRKPPQFDFAAEIRQLQEPIEADSPFMIAWWDSPTPVDPDFIRRQRQDAARIPLRVWLAVLDQGLSGDHLYADLQSTLPRLEAPTLLIWGSKDPIMDEAVRKTLSDALPAAQVKVFDGLGHNPFWEEPARVARVINGFLDAASVAAPPAGWPDSFVARIEALALLQTLNADLLSHDSATATLEHWCELHRLASPPRIVAARVTEVEKPPSPDQRRELGVTPREVVRYRRVRLMCGPVVLSEADNWYVPGRLTPEMNRLLDTTDAPFGRVVQALHFRRRTLSSTLLWHPLPEGWEMDATAARDATGELTIPHRLLEHRAVLSLPDGTPFSEVVETYTGQVLGFRFQAR